MRNGPTFITIVSHFVARYVLLDIVQQCCLKFWCIYFAAMRHEPKLLSPCMTRVFTKLYYSNPLTLPGFPWYFHQNSLSITAYHDIGLLTSETIHKIRQFTESRQRKILLVLYCLSYLSLHNSIFSWHQNSNHLQKPLMETMHPTQCSTNQDVAASQN